MGVASAICNELESYSTGNCIDELCNGEVDNFRLKVRIVQEIGRMV